MPELPEVETIARGLAERLSGLRIADVHLYRADMLCGDIDTPDELVGRRITSVTRCGKFIHLLLDRGRDDLSWYVHLGMTGRLILADRTRHREDHMHLRIGFRGCPFELRYCDPRRFGRIWLTKNGSTGADNGAGWRGRRLLLSRFDPLTVSLAQLRTVLDRRRRIKALLLDQQYLGGLGNIYCDEILFRAGVHPLTPAADLKPAAVARLRRAMRRVLAEAIRAGGSTISDYRNADNEPGRFQERHRVYNRAGQPCDACRTPIERNIVAGRGTYTCPVCQPASGSSDR